MKHTTRITGLAVAAVALMIASPAFADKGGKSKSHESHENYERHHESSSDHDGTTVIRIGDDDRVVLHRYLEDNYKKDCPPGLAKKHNGCLPPGQAKKYAIGDRLSDDVVFYPVPHDILEHLRPAPSGYKYVRVDTDVLLIGEASKKIIDAVTLLSGVGQQ